MTSFSKRSLQDYESGDTIPYRHFAELGNLLGRRPEWFLHGDDAVVFDEQRLREIVREELEAVLERYMG